LSNENEHPISLFYRVGGLSEQWFKLEQPRSTIDLINLPVGSYSVEVQSVDRFNLRSEPHLLAIHISPHWWASSIALFIYVFVVLSLVLWLVYKRVKHYRNVVSENESLNVFIERFELCLWATEYELWDWHINKNKLYRFSTQQKIDFGVQRNEVLFDELQQYVHPEDIVLLEEKLEQCIVGTIEQYDITIRVRDIEGKWCWMQDRARVVSRNKNGIAERITGGLNDIKSLKLRELALAHQNTLFEQKIKQRTHQLEDNNAQLVQTLDQLEKAQNNVIDIQKISSLAHLVTSVFESLKSPMSDATEKLSASSKSLKQLICQVKAGTLQNTEIANVLLSQKQQSDAIEGDVKQVEQLFLYLMNTMDEQLVKQLFTINLHDYFSQIRSSLSTITSGHNVRISFECADNLVIQTYPGVWYQIIFNLVKHSLNAYSEKHQNGTISINACLCENKLVIIYQDDELNMQPELYNALSHSSNPPEFLASSNFELYFVYYLVTQLLNGEITARKQANKGGAFEIVCAVQYTPG
jgi:PAS domain S-box-containing protein